jgi:hypothetical protein
VSRYTIVVPSDAPEWAQRLETDLNRALSLIRLDLKPKRFGKADLPTDDSERLVIVTDEAGGTVLAFFDGTDWRRATDRAVVS